MTSLSMQFQQASSAVGSITSLLLQNFILVPMVISRMRFDYGMAGWASGVRYFLELLQLIFTSKKPDDHAPLPSSRIQLLREFCVLRRLVALAIGLMGSYLAAQQRCLGLYQFRCESDLWVIRVTQRFSRHLHTRRCGASLSQVSLRFCLS